MKKLARQFLYLLLLSFNAVLGQPGQAHNLQFNNLASRWDEAMPLGNGMLGALVWQKNEHLRISLDRADLWDERKVLDLSKFNFKWVEEQVLKKDYTPVQRLGDEPNNASAYPSKLPAAAVEFDTRHFGKVVSNTLDIRTALNTVRFETGVVFKCYVHATLPQGFFSFENLPSSQIERALTAAIPVLVVHNYNSGATAQNDNSHGGQGLEKLGYAKGTITKTANSIHYRQPTYNGHYYEVLLQWEKMPGNRLLGTWTITNDKQATVPDFKGNDNTITGWASHLAWWKHYWEQSAIHLPDSLIEKQYYLEMYKLGAVARAGAPAITLQAIWTADNGSLPPWKGDFHNDLNTQLSYWPCYTGNRLAEGTTYTDWLWKIRQNNLAYTKQYFGVDGLNVPGVVTFSGYPMGGWIQYSLSPTVVAWCAQHFYWQWKYSMDDRFLKERAYPYLHDAATYLENITRLENGKRKLPLSSSPEYNDNSIKAWFFGWTNFDLSLAKYLFTAAGELASATGKKEEAEHWQQVLAQLPAYDVNGTGLTIAPGHNLDGSHRHMSQYMSIYPLALLDYNRPQDKEIIDNSFRRLEEKGTRAWCGYSFSWMASLYARAYKADSAVKQLRIFASNFCSSNSFHLNGDQKGGQYSNFTYRPFTLEGNFAFAQGVHELLLQSRNGYIQVFPSVPSEWKSLSFNNLRAEGAFLVSARKEKGVTVSVKVTAEKGGILKIRLPLNTMIVKDIPTALVKKGADGIVTVRMRKGQTILFEKFD